MAILDVTQKAFEVILVLGGTLMLLAFEVCVLDIAAAMLAPIFRLHE